MPRYFLNLFSPRTWNIFLRLETPVSAHKPRFRRLASEVKPGDVFVCYVTGISRFCGALEATGSLCEDATPIYGNPDPFSLRWPVRKLVALPGENGIPVRADVVWNHVLGLRTQDRAGSRWTGRFRRSLSELPAEDGAYLVELLKRQQVQPTDYPLTDSDRAALEASPTVVSPSGETVPVSVPDSGADAPTSEGSLPEDPQSSLNGIAMQARLARVGAEMGLDVWVPASDRAWITAQLPPQLQARLLTRLPVNFDEATLKTVSNIDVLWLRGGTILRAFEVEHTTSIYSGLLRIADLLALQPNIRIKAHIVAPAERLDKWRREVKRPVFALLSGGPLAETCSFLDYAAVEEVAALPTLRHTNHAVLEEYEDRADEA